MHISFANYIKLQYHFLQCYNFICFAYIYIFIDLDLNMYIYILYYIHVNTYNTHTSMINKFSFNNQLPFRHSMYVPFAIFPLEESNTKHCLAQPATLHGGLSTRGVSWRVAWQLAGWWQLFLVENITQSQSIHDTVVYCSLPWPPTKS